MKKALLFLCIMVTACAQVGPLQEDAKSCSRSGGFVGYSYCINAALKKATAGSPNPQATAVFSKITSLRAEVNRKELSHEEAMDQLDLFIAQQAAAETSQTGQTVLLAVLAAGALAASAYALSQRDRESERSYKNRKYAYEKPLMCSRVRHGYPRCSSRKACGNTCIDPSKTCNAGRGTACNLRYHSYP
ncbi:hypothetical protein ABWI00_15130 [Algihabitans albus]|uniref:hypothetical protein n=1 Tax=Algihabitans albus TaxID=2164067 RepID=UPI0035D0314E